MTIKEKVAMLGAKVLQKHELLKMMKLGER
jgi:hypothetical protein